MRENVSVETKHHARAMRREPTEAERKLWWALRDRRFQSVKFRRQAPVGPYIADFLCIQHRLVVEADGSGHAENARDARRDAWFVSHGYRVLRFWNHEILLEQEGVLANIAGACGLPW